MLQILSIFTLTFEPKVIFSLSSTHHKKQLCQIKECLLQNVLRLWHKPLFKTCCPAVCSVYNWALGSKFRLIWYTDGICVLHTKKTCCADLFLVGYIPKVEKVTIYDRRQNNYTIILLHRSYITEILLKMRECVKMKHCTKFLLNYFIWRKTEFWLGFGCKWYILAPFFFFIKIFLLLNYIDLQQYDNNYLDKTLVVRFLFSVFN